MGLEHKRCTRNTRYNGAKTEEDRMAHRLTMVYWKGQQFWLGKLLEHPEIMTQGETLEELEANLKDAYRLMVLEDVPDDYQWTSASLPGPCRRSGYSAE